MLKLGVYLFNIDFYFFNIEPSGPINETVGPNYRILYIYIYVYMYTVLTIRTRTCIHIMNVMVLIGKIVTNKKWKSKNNIGSIKINI
jgi:hypothetical protein